MGAADLRVEWPAGDPMADLDAVDLRLETFRAAIDQARRNGWQAADQVGADLEEYLDAVRLSQRDALERRIRRAEAGEVDGGPASGGASVVAASWRGAIPSE
jgi:hypothetical protein